MFPDGTGWIACGSRGSCLARPTVNAIGETRVAAGADHVSPSPAASRNPASRLTAPAVGPELSTGFVDKPPVPHAFNSLLVPDGSSYRQIKVRLADVIRPNRASPTASGSSSGFPISRSVAERGLRAGHRPLWPHGRPGLCRRVRCRLHSGRSPGSGTDQRFPDGDKPIPATIRLDPPRGLSAHISVPQPVFSSA